MKRNAHFHDHDCFRGHQ